MKNLFVPYEIAKTIKEKGFKETTLGHYYGRDNDQVLVIYGEFPPDTSKWLPAPLYQQAVDFILSKGVYVGVSDFTIHKNLFGYRYGRGNTISGYIPHFEGTTRIEALNFAIKGALTLLKEVDHEY